MVGPRRQTFVCDYILFVDEFRSIQVDHLYLTAVAMFRYVQYS